MLTMDFVYGVFVFIIATCIASFMNVVIYRLPNKMNLAKPASHCPKCNEPIKWYDNIPLISFIVLGGKCRHCKQPISPRYFIVELLGGVISTLIFVRFGLTPNSIFGIILFLCLIPIAFIDAEHMEIPDLFIVILLVVGIIGIFFNDLDYGQGYLVVDWQNKLIGFGAIAGLAIIAILVELLFKIEFIGIGDLKLFAVIALFLGWTQMILVVGLSSITASIFQFVKAAIIAFKNRNKEKENNDNGVKFKQFPFGPFIAAASIIIYCFGVNIIEWWLTLLSF